MLVIFRQNTKVIALLSGQKYLIFIIFQSAIKINQLLVCQQNTKVIALLFGQKSLIFITSTININQSSFGKIPRLQPYFLAKNRSFSSLVNLQSKSNNFNVGHFSAKYQGYSLTVWPKIAHFFIMFQSAIKINQFQCWSVFGKIPRLQPYFLANNRSFSSLLNLQSKSFNFNVGHLSAKYQGYSLTFWPKIAHFFIMFQSAITINQFQCWSVFGKIPRLQPYFLAKNRSFSSLFNLQSKSNNFNVGHFSAKYQGFQPYSLAKNRSFSSLFNLQSKSNNFNVGHFSAKYQGYSLTVWPKIAHFFIMFQSAIKINHFQCWSVFGKIPRLQPYFLPKIAQFHHFSICNQNQSISMLVMFRQNTKVIALLFGQKSLIFITFQSAIKINQFQCWSVVSKIRMLQPYFLAKNRSFSSLFNLQSKSINFNIGQFSAKYQGYSLTFWPKIAHFHHFSICNQNQSTSSLVSCQQNTKVIALCFGQKSLIFITFQSAIKIKQF